jgi:hypothetical protein
MSNSSHPSSGQLVGFLINTDPPVLNLDVDVIVISRNSQLDVLCLAVVTRIMQQFKDNGQDGCLKLAPGSIDGQIVVELDRAARRRLNSRSASE